MALVLKFLEMENYWMLQWPEKKIEDSKEYKVATLDYLAEGNDHMTAFAKVAMRINCCLKRHSASVVSELCE